MKIFILTVFFLATCFAAENGETGRAKGRIVGVRNLSINETTTQKQDDENGPERNETNGESHGLHLGHLEAHSSDSMGNDDVIEGIAHGLKIEEKGDENKKTPKLPVGINSKISSAVAGV